MTAAVEARDLFRVYRSPEGEAAALQGLSLTIEEGEIVAVLGPSGSGKSTLLRMLAGLDRPSVGRLRVFGLDVAHLSGRDAARYRAETIGYMEQHYWRALDPDLCVRELVGVQLALAGISKRERRLRAGELLEHVGLGDREHARPAELSGGERQRVAVCAALAHRPRLLLADEPTGELDQASARGVYQLLSALARREKCATVLVSHDPAVTSIADRTVHIRDGRVSEETVGRESGDHRIVVGRGGWLRLPEDLLAKAGIRTRAGVRIGPEGVVVTPVAEEDGTRSDTAGPASLDLETTHRGGRAAELSGVTVRYGSGRRAVTVLNELSASFRSGTFTAVTGPSGSGKTTLLLLLAGLTLPTSGDVRVLGRPVHELDRRGRAELRREHVAYVGQQTELVPFLTARENVELALALRRRETKSTDGLATEVLALVGLAERTEHRVARLSAGERQRVAVARALASGCAVLLADEPTARLDQANALAIGELFASLTERNSVAIVCATHDRLLAEQADDELELGRGPEARFSSRSSARGEASPLP